jgi:hypothetical protein
MSYVFLWNSQVAIPRQVFKVVFLLVVQELPVELQQLYSVGDLVDHSMASAMPSRPKFEVLRSIVETVTIPVMDCFLRSQRPTKDSFHNQPVLKHQFPAGADITVTVSVDVTTPKAGCPFTL